MDRIVDSVTAGRGRRIAAWLVAYLAIMSAVVGAMLLARGRALRDFGTSAARSDWQRWQATANEQSQQDWKGPVRRRIRKHAEPPALVLMRDHFVPCLVFALVISSALFVPVAVFSWGVFSCRHVRD